MQAGNLRRLAAIVRWIAIGWIVAVCLALALLPGGLANREDFFDDAILIGLVPGALGLLLSYVTDKAGRRADPSASEEST
jgi:hypothetical protein